MLAAPDFSTPLALWLLLFLAVYLLHLFEEFFAGVRLARDQSQMRGVNMTARQFIVAAIIAAAFLTIGIYLTLLLHFPQWSLAGLATVMLINGFSHTITGARRWEYTPGLITGILIFIPLGFVMLFRLYEIMRFSRFSSAVLAGVGAHALISLLGRKGGIMMSKAEVGRRKAERAIIQPE